VCATALEVINADSSVVGSLLGLNTHFVFFKVCSICASLYLEF
jgi:hypothetical protein